MMENVEVALKKEALHEKPQRCRLEPRCWVTEEQEILGKQEHAGMKTLCNNQVPGCPRGCLCGSWGCSH